MRRVKVMVKPTKDGLQVRVFTPKKVGAKTYLRGTYPSNTPITEILEEAAKKGAPLANRGIGREGLAQ